MALGVTTREPQPYRTVAAHEGLGGPQAGHGSAGGPTKATWRGKLGGQAGRVAGPGGEEREAPSVVGPMHNGREAGDGSTGDGRAGAPSLFSGLVAPKIPVQRNSHAAG